MEMIKIKFPVPTVLECMNFVSECVQEQKRTVKNYEFDLYLGGKREITIDGTSYTVKEGSLVFRRPGQFTVGKGDYNMNLLTLDFSSSVNNDSKLFRSIEGTCQEESEFEELHHIPTVFQPIHYEELKRLFEHLSHCSFPAVADLNKQKEYIKEFLLLVLYDAQIYNRKSRFLLDETSSAVKQVHNYILEHFCEQLKIRDIASMFYLNENYLIQSFKKKYNITPNQYLLETRLIHARYLLLYSERSVQDVAFSCGFKTTSYFIKKFQERFQKTPHAFRLDLKSKYDS